MLKTAVRGGLYKVKVRSFAGPYRPSIERVKNGDTEAILQAERTGLVEPRNSNRKLFPPKRIPCRYLAGHRPSLSVAGGYHKTYWMGPNGVSTGWRIDRCPWHRSKRDEI